MKTNNFINSAKKGILFASFMTSFLTGSLYAQKQEQPDQKMNTDKCLSPYFWVTSNDDSVDQLPLKETGATVHIAGVIADVQIKQVYKNTGTKTLEAVYVFPASTRAAVYAMHMKIGEREIIAVIQEKEKARQNYEQAKQNGQTASLLEEERPNVFRMSVANILPGDVIEVNLKYTELLIPENGEYRFIFPSVVGPRYTGNHVNDEDHWVANPYLKQGSSVNYKFNVQVDLSTGLPLRDLKSPSHEVQIAFQGANKASVKLKDRETFQGNRDFILQYRLAGNAIGSGMILYRGEKENFFLAMVQPPHIVTPEKILPREYIFIVDVSGSMYGFPLDISKKLMTNLLSRLRPSDRFNVVLFAGGSRLLSAHSLEATEENIQKAIHLINDQKGGGGTELLSALKKAMLLAEKEGVSRTFVIATDGYVSVEKETFDFIRKNLGKANFFSFGIGSSVNRYLIEGMAHVGKGKPFVITNPQGAEISATAFRKYISSPVLTRIEVNFEGFNAYDIEPANYPDVFGERPLILFGKWKGRAKGQLEISGVSVKGPWSKTLQVDRADVSTQNHALVYLWARDCIRTLDDYGQVNGNRDEIKATVLNLGLKYNLLTKYTSFLALDSEIRNEGGALTTVKQPLPLPAGVSNYAVGGYAKKLFTYAARIPVSRQNNIKEMVEEEEDIALEMSIPKLGIVYKIVETMPEFPGGVEGLKKFLKQNLSDPEQFLNGKEGGVVFVQFTVDVDGSVKDIKVIRGIGLKTDAEAIRLIRLTDKKWKPGKQRGRKVAVQMIVPIRFTCNATILKRAT